ncbi:MAG: hypothetical protein WC444_00075 [Candidatus Paceibacterota bacterium]
MITEVGRLSREAARDIVLYTALRIKLFEDSVNPFTWNHDYGALALLLIREGWLTETGIKKVICSRLIELGQESFAEYRAGKFSVTALRTPHALAYAIYRREIDRASVALLTSRGVDVTHFVKQYGTRLERKVFMQMFTTYDCHLTPFR